MFLYSQKKKRTGKNIMDNVQNFLEALLDYTVCLYIMLMLAVFPFYNEEGYTHIGTDKSTFLCRLSINAGKILVVPLLLYLLVSFIVYIRDKKEAYSLKEMMRERISLTDIFAAVYCIALLLSYALTDYRENALWGARGWYMGLIPQLILIAIYFLISRLWCPRRWVLFLAIPASAAVFVLGCLNRFGIYPIEMAYAGPSYISTIGNINWYCGYAVSVAFLGIVLPWAKPGMKAWQKTVLMAYTVLSFVSLIVQGSESGLVALAVVLLVMFCCSVKDRERMLVFWQEMVLLCGGCLIVYMVRLFAPEEYLMSYVGGFGEKLTFGWLPVVMTMVSVLCLIWVWRGKTKGTYSEKFFCILAKTAVLGCAAAVAAVLLLATVNTVRPGSIGKLSGYKLFTFNENWGSSRGATWSAGWRCFTSQNLVHKVIGVGPDCMPEFLYSGENAVLLADVKEKFGTARLTNAHNEWLTILVNTGVLGLIGFGGMMVSGMRDFMKKGRENSIVCACGFCLLAYTVNNIFSFQQSMSVGTIFVIFGIGEAFLRKGYRFI